MRKPHPSPRMLVAEAKAVLSAWRPTIKRSPLEEVLELLAEGRGYSGCSIYLVMGESVRLQSHHGPTPASDSYALGEASVGTVAKNGITKEKTMGLSSSSADSEMVVPIKIGGRVLGVLTVQNERRSAKDRILVHEVAHLLARFLTSNGKHLVRKAREAAAAQMTAESTAKPYRATSEKNPTENSLRRAAAGEASRA